MVQVQPAYLATASRQADAYNLSREDNATDNPIRNESYGLCTIPMTYIVTEIPIFFGYVG